MSLVISIEIKSELTSWFNSKLLVNYYKINIF